MSTGLIIAIVVVVLILIGLLVLMPRMRAKAREREARKELHGRRERVATEHREEASTRSSRAEEAERKAAIAQQNARAERAQAESLEQQAQLHERGLADDELIDDHERDRFDGVSGSTATADERDDHVSRGDGDVERDHRPVAREATADDTAGGANSEYERGREDEPAEREPRR